MVLVGAAGCSQSRPPAAPPKPVLTKPSGPPIFDGRRGGGSFPLMGSKAVPATPGELEASLLAGYVRRLVLPAGTVPVTVGGEKLESLKQILIDVSGSRIRPDYEPTQLQPHAKKLKTVHADRVVYSAWPVEYENAKLSVRLSATDATLDVLRDSEGKTGLVLAGAGDSRFEMEVTRDDLERGFFAAGKKGAGRMGIRVESASLALATPTSRALVGDLRVKCWWLLIPMAFHVHGRMDVREAEGEFFATFSEMSATPDDIGGALATGFLDPMVKKLEQRVAPLAKFRDEGTKVKDFYIDASAGALRVEMRAGR